MTAGEPEKDINRGGTGVLLMRKIFHNQAICHVKVAFHNKRKECVDNWPENCQFP